jgi:hypothetical protein
MVKCTFHEVRTNPGSSHQTSNLMTALEKLNPHRVQIIIKRTGLAFAENS